MLLTYEETVEIAKINESFKIKYENFEETTVAQCTYFLASVSDFFDAKKDGSMVRATELRGITFVNENKGEGWKRYLFVDKFFNVNQTNGSNVTYMNLSINGESKICNINKLYITNENKVIRAHDLKLGLFISEYNRVEEIANGPFFEIIELAQETLLTSNPSNSWMYQDIKDLDIKRVADKEDGSAIRFLILNGELVAKTKFSLQSDQCALSMAVVNADLNLKKFIIETLEKGLAALFEIVSPENKVVLSYKKTDLKLIQLRVEETGEYLNIYKNELVASYKIRTAHEEDLYKIKKVAYSHSKEKAIEKLQDLKFKNLNDFLSLLGIKGECENDNHMSVLDLLLLSKDYIEDKEGYVITMSNKMAKVKHNHYMAIHGILSEGLKEHKLVTRIVENTIDDVIAQIPENNVEEREFIDELTTVITNHINHLATEAQKLYEKDNTGIRKDLVIKHKSNLELFPYIMLYASGKDYEYVEKTVAENVQFACRRYVMAKDYLKKMGFEKTLKLISDE